MVLTDRPDVMIGPGLLPPERGVWRPARDLDEPTATLWAHLGGAAAPWRMDLPVRGAAERFWSRIILIANAPGSQFDLLRDQLASVVRGVGPVACVALDGRNFHGQRGRPWHAVAGNLHLSVAVPVGLDAPTFAPSLSMLPAVATVEAVVTATGGAVRPGIKWVNDIVLPAGKLAGVLTATQVLGGDIDLVVFGIGLNVSAAPPIVPTPFVPRAVSLQQCPGAGHVTLGATLWAVLGVLARRLERLDAPATIEIWQDYTRASIVLGRQVRVWRDGTTETEDVSCWPAPLATGVVTDIGRDLTLGMGGHLDRIGSGRLALEEACQMFGL